MRREWREKGRFNPHSSFRPSATIHPLLALLRPEGFQSSLELSPECNKVHLLPCPACAGVSILTRAFARVQHVDAAAIIGSLHLFQSSLELSPECNALVDESHKNRDLVSILTRAFARVQRLGKL